MESPTNNIPFGRPLLGQEEIDAVTEVLSGPQLVHGPRAREFEERFANRIGARHAVTVSSCTAGLHLSLFVKDVSVGDKVIVPAMTHVATAHAVEFCGAEPLFVDVQESTGNIDPDLIADAITDDVRAIMVVHYLGLPCDMDPIMETAERSSVFVVEDCALAVDATYGGTKVGNFGASGCFSFYPVKHMTTLEGGMVTSNDDAMAALVANRKAFGYDQMLGERKKPGIYDVTALGYNYRMNEVQAAVGLEQLKKLDRFQQDRENNFMALKAELNALDEVTVFEPEAGKARSSFYCLNAVLPKDGSIDRSHVVEHLKASGIGSSVHYPSAVPLYSYYKEKYGYSIGQFPVSEWLADQTISLPVGPHVQPDDPAKIAAALKDAIVETRK